ncbi:MAG: hypothetical protein AB7F43_04385 [Bacteriovoracia bacterium]
MSTEQKTLLFASDPGGINEIVALSLRKTNPVLFIDEPTKQPSSLYSNKKIFFRIISSVGQIPSILEKEKPTEVYCGTSHTGLIEHAFFQECQKRKIPVYALVDHWNNFKERFVRNNILILPDIIFVNDSLAKQLAIESGLPSEKIKILMNPYFENVRQFKPSESRNIFLKKYGISTANKLIIFLSDCLSETSSNPKEEFGFTEIEAMQIAKKQFCDSNSEFVVKLHPKENEAKFEGFNVKTIKNIPLHDLIFFADQVLGMFSAAVFEASLLNKNVVRIEPGAKKDYLPFLQTPRFTQVTL